jgi:hypothetical protein
LINKLRVYDETIKRTVAARVTNFLKISVAVHGASQFSKPALECLFVMAFELPEVFVMLVLGRAHRSFALSGLKFILFVAPGRRSFHCACPKLLNSDEPWHPAVVIRFQTSKKPPQFYGVVLFQRRFMAPVRPSLKTAGTGQTIRAAALAVQFLFALQWPPLHEVWVCHSIVFVEVRHSTPKPEMESGETPTP